MSTTIDQRVVEMRFDNKQFESNVSTTMSTLDKLKRSLRLTDASKGLENVSAAAKKVDFSGMTNGIETVQTRFSYLQATIQHQLNNIVDSAVNAGKRMVSALTIDPIKTGFSEYETQINAVQTILANTESKGTTLDQVNMALDTLNTYADKTIYNFTEMTRNIGTFTAAGVDLETSVNSIQGIANLAAVSGSNAQQASTAMYQLSQALSAGTVKLMDWNSVVNAGMGGQVFQDALKETARVHGIAIDDMIEKQGSFRETLSEGWITSEILTETLEKFTLATEGLTKEQIEANREMLRAKGYTEEQIEGIFKLGNTATNAATKVKTFTQLWDTLKEAAQSGWTQTWELIVGDFEKAKTLWTGISDYVGEIINNFSNARNTLLEGALTSNWDKLVKKINDAGIETTDFEERVRNAAKSHGKNLDSLIEKHGSFEEAVRSGAISTDILKEALGGTDKKLKEITVDFSSIERLLGRGTIGEDVKKIQEALDGLGFDLGEWGVDGIIGPATEKAIKEFQKVNNLKVDGLVGPETIAALEKAASSTEELGEASGEAIEGIDELIDGIGELGGRELLLEALKNVAMAIVKPIEALGTAWRNTFEAMKPEELYNIISGFLKFTENLVLSDGKLKLLQHTFEGVFAILEVITTLVGGGLKIAFRVLSAVLGYFNMDILDLTAGIADSLIQFRDWFDSVLDIEGAIAFIMPYVTKAINAIKDWFEAFRSSEAFTNFTSKISNAISAIKEWFNSLKDSENLPADIARGLGKGLGTIVGYIKDFISGGFSGSAGDIIAGLIQGIKNGVPKIVSAIIEFVTTFVDAFKAELGIHSPSTVFMTLGGFIIGGLVMGLLNSSSDINTTFTNIFNSVIEFIKGIDFGAVFALVIAGGLIYTVKRIGDALEIISGPIASFTDIVDTVKDTIEGLGKSFQTYLKAQAMKTVAEALLMLVGAVVVLTFIDPGKLWSAIGAIAVISGVLAGLTILIGKFGPKETGEIAKYSLALLSLSGSILVMAIAMRVIGGMDAEQTERAGKAILVLGAIIAGLVWASQLAGPSIDKIGTSILKISAAMLLMAFVAKIAGQMSVEEMKTAGIVVGAFALLVVGLIAASKLAGKGIGAISKTIIGIAGAIAVLVIVAKVVAGMSWEEMGKAAAGIGFLSAIVVGLIAATKLGKDTNKVGATLLAIAGSIAILAFTAKLISSMPVEAMKKGAAGILALAAIVSGLVWATKLAGDSAPKIAGTLLAMSLAIAVLAGVAILLSFISVEGLAKGITAVGLLSAFVAGLVYVTKDAQQCVGTIVALTVAIAVMAAAVAGLSLIDPTKLAGATAAMAALISVLALLVHSTKGANASIGPLIVLTVAIGLMGGILYLLSGLPVESTIGSAVALSALMLAMSGVLFVLSKIGNSATKALGGAIMLTLLAVPLLAFVGVLAAMQNVQNALGNVVALSLLAAAMTVLLIPLSAIGSGTGLKDAVLGVVALLAMAVPLLAFVAVLAVMQNVQNAERNALILVGLATAMTLLLIPLTLIGALGMMGLPYLGVLALLTMATPLLAFVYILDAMQGIEGAKENANLLMSLMNALTDILIKVSIIAPLAVLGVSAIAGIELCLVAFGALAVAVGALNEYVPDFQDFVTNSIAILKQLAAGLGECIGAFITAIATSVMDLLPQLGTALSSFAINAMPFIMKMRLVNGDVLAGVGIMAASIIALSAADLVAGITSFLSGGIGWGDLGAELSAFATEVVPFLDVMSNVDPAVFEGVSALAEAMLVLTAADLVGQIMEFLTGESSLASFGAEIAAFGPHMATFADSVAHLTEDSLAAMKISAEAGKTLAEMANTMPKEGGWLQGLLGESDAGTFGEQLSAFGEGLVSYANSVKDLDVDAVNNSIEPAKKLAELGEAIPNMGGLWADVFGDNDIAAFGEQVTSFGKSLMEYGEAVVGIDTYTDAIDSSVTAGTKLQELASAIPDIGGLWAKVVGDSSMETFGEQIVAFARALLSYSMVVTGQGGIDIEAISNSVEAGKWLAKLGDVIPTSGGFVAFFTGDNDMATFGEQIKLFGAAMVDYSATVAGINTSKVTSSVNAASKLAELAQDISGVDFGSISNFGTALKNMGDAGIDEFVAAFDGADIKAGNAISNLLSAIIDKIKSKQNQFNIAGSKLMAELSTGMNDAKSALTTSVTSMLKTIISTVEDKYISFYNSGKYVVDGFAAGITAQTWKAEARAKAMAEAAVEAAREELDVNSPSKVFRALGYSVPEGFAMGIDKLSGMAVSSSRDMADTAIDTVRSSISRIADTINSDIDSQPTIRPVLDLSEVEAGAGTIGGMLGMSPSVGVLSNINAISSMMGNRQNGTNGDVISAIKDLGRRIGNSTGNTYNVNGVTYDDGSNVSEAVKSLVRAARIERRT